MTATTVLDPVFEHAVANADVRAAQYVDGFALNLHLVSQAFERGELPDTDTIATLRNRTEQAHAAKNIMAAIEVYQENHDKEQLRTTLLQQLNMAMIAQDTTKFSAMVYNEAS